jgi:hypothetical protein
MTVLDLAHRADFIRHATAKNVHDLTKPHCLLLSAMTKRVETWANRRPYAE